jgi:raffinose/stachyose/melibiose transport system permease protein
MGWPAAQNARPRRRWRVTRADERLPGTTARTPYLYLTPALAVYAVFVLYPLGQTFWLSLSSWDGVTPGRYIGFSNYRQLLASSSVRSSYLHAAILVGFYSAIPVVLGLCLAATIVRSRIRGATVYRTIVFLPQVIATAAAAVAWIWLYAPGGPIAIVLSTIGMGSRDQALLGNYSLALPALGMIGVWANTGLCMVLFVAGMQRLPQSLYDAARVDGCGAIRELIAITLPGIRGEIGVALTLTIIAGLSTFDVVYIITGGGPGTSTLVPSLAIFLYAFRDNEVGLACAAGVVLTASVFLATYAVRRLVGATSA